MQKFWTIKKELFLNCNHVLSKDDPVERLRWINTHARYYRVLYYIMHPSADPSSSFIQPEFEQLCRKGYPPENINKIDQGNDACSLPKMQS
jgi:hypothetical protein